ncbi:MAG: ABC transporter permease subunit [Chloroflexi bacterium]|nr:ABC transporter permease subunit [Chloroflexota bacterium]MXY00685.1 ABC transporter permease subunit [Chloroflexota bacterium]MYB16691.1 ABC transporter permease subunit [Chloroflexota bacterium]MYC48397.1 ABC transporter permease subunit [Chloroflexota bacterium]
MTLANITLKTARDRWLGWVISAVSLALLLLFGMAAYREIDLTIYTELPEAFRSLFGIGEGVDAGGLAVGYILGSFGAFVTAAMALVFGSAAIAGEERNGTMNILLANPKSRTHVLLSKAASLVVLAALTVAILWASVYPAAALMDVEISGLEVEALALHLYVNAVYYGMLALAIGAITGNRDTASGVAAGILVISFFAVGLLPLVEGLENLRKAFPWYYFDGSDPIYNGIAWDHLAVLASASVVLLVAAMVGFGRRDLKSQSVGTSLLDRMRSNPILNRIVGRLAGSARVSSIWLKTVSDYQTLLLVTSAAMFLVMGVILGPMYASLTEETRVAFHNFPEELIALFGGGELGTPEGWYTLETFGLMAPLAVILVTAVTGAGALAGEESRRTMGLLLANPIRRSRIVIEKSATMTLFGIAVGIATFAGVSLGSVFGDLGMSFVNIGSTAALQVLSGLVFGFLALAIGAGTGRASAAIYGAVGAALVSHLLTSLVKINDGLAGIAWLSPFHYYLVSDPLNTGMDWGDALVLTVLSAALFGLSIFLFQRRDIRQRG